MSVIERIDRCITRHERTVLVAIFMLALVVRVVLVLAVRGNDPIPGDDDQSDYHQYAQRIIDGDWLTDPVSVREVGYPLFLSLAYRAGERNFLAGRLANALVGALTCVLIYLLARTVFGSGVAFFSAMWWVFYFHSLFYTLFIQREILVTALLVLFLWLIARASGRRALRYLVVSCLVYAALIHTDARYLFHLPFVALYVALATGSLRVSVKRGLIFAVVLVAAMTPWQYRNYKVYRQFVLVNTRTLVKPLPWVTGPVVSIDRPPPKPVDDPGFRRLVGMRNELYDLMEFYRAYRFRGEVRANSSTWEASWSLGHNLVSIAMYGVLLPFFLYGSWLIIRRRWTLAYVFVMPVVAHTLLHLIKWGRTRYRVPIEPVIIILALYGVSMVWDAYRKRRVSSHA